jgi:23S rRNA (uracil1939-C5)-methyltransferase
VARRKREPETAVIDAVTHDGRGIASTGGKKAFVAGALAGETVRFIRRKRRRNYDEAELLDVIEASPERIEPRCAAFGRCGGCSLQHVTPEQQRAIKDQVLRDNLARIGRVEPERWLTPMTGPEWNYRRRARLAVKDVPGKGRTLVGFREKHAPFITDMLRCEVLAKPLDGMISALSELVGSLSIRARVPQIEVAVAENASALVFRVLDEPGEADIKALQAFGAKQQIRIYLQTGGLDTVKRLTGEGGDEPLYYTLPEFNVTIEFGPVDFIQVNGAINRQMVGFAVEQLEAGADDRILDLYCGIGNFSLPLARSAGSVIGIEGDAGLVSRAAANARSNGIDNAEFRSADLSRIDGRESWVRAGCDRMLLDPARSGAAEVVRQMHVLGPQRIVYVSCHPGTLARDAGLLVHDKGYTLEAAGIIDMFPHTAHVESIAVFNRFA